MTPLAAPGLAGPSPACGWVEADIGCAAWDARAKHDPAESESVSLVVEGAGGILHAAGKSKFSALTAAYDGATGALLRAKRYDAERFRDPAALAVDGGRVIVSASGLYPHPTNPTWSVADGTVFAEDATTGALLWSTRLLDAGTPRLVASEGRILGAATTDGVGDLLVFALDGATGAFLWTHLYAGPAAGPDAASSVALAGGRFFVAAQSWGGATYYDHLVLSLDPATGAVAWSQRINTHGFNHNEMAPLLATSADGARVFVAGTVRDQLSDSWRDYFTSALDGATGAHLWSHTLGREDASLPDEVRGLAATPDGSRVVVTGTVRAYWNPCCIGMDDVVTAAYDGSTGGLLWRDQFASPGVQTTTGNTQDDARGVLLSPDGGSAFVAIEHQGSWSLLAYDVATGLREGRVVTSKTYYWSALASAAPADGGERIVLAGFDAPSSTSRSYARLVAFDADFRHDGIANPPFVPGGI